MKNNSHSKAFKILKKNLKEQLGITLYCDKTDDGLYLVGVREILNLEAVGNTEEAIAKFFKIIELEMIKKKTENQSSHSNSFENLKKKLKEHLGITLYCDKTNDGLYLVGVREILNLEAIGNTEVEAILKLTIMIAESEIKFE